MNRESKTWWSDLLILVVIISLGYFAFLGSRPLMVPDEARYAEISKEMAVSGDYITPTLNGLKYFEKPPLFYWLESFAIKIFGLNEWFLRLLPALIGIMGCLVVYFTARKLFDRQIGLLSAFILATSGLYNVLSHFIILDGLLAFCLTCCLCSFLLAIHEPQEKIQKWYFWAMYAFAALATLTKGLIGIALPGLIIFSWMLLFNQWNILKRCRLFSGTLIFLAITLPWHILMQWRNPDFFQFYFVEQHFLRYLTKYANREQALWFLPVCILGGFYPWVGFLFQSLAYNFPKSWQQRAVDKIPGFLIIWALVIFIFYSFSHSQLLPYILPVFPALAIITGRYIRSVWDSSYTRGMSWGYAVIFIIGITASIIGIFVIEHDPIWVKSGNHSHYLYFLAVVFILQCLLPVWLYVLGHLRNSVIVLIVLSGLLFALAQFGYGLIDNRSIKPLALALKPQLQPSDIVINYHDYHQDLVFYTNHRTVLVGWPNELEFGFKHLPDVKQWWLSEDKEFLHLWAQPRKAYTIISNSDLLFLEHNTRLPFYIVAKASNYALVSNTSIKP